MHKYTQQTSREPLSGDDAHLMREAAEVETRLVEEQAPAEQVIDHLRSERAQDSTLTAEQARAERIADISRRLKASRQPQNATSADNNVKVNQTEAVDQAVAWLKAKRQQEAAERRVVSPEKDDASPQAQTRKVLDALKARQEEAAKKSREKRDVVQEDGPSQKIREAERLEQERRRREVDPPAPGRDRGPRYGR